jgi:hydroxyethylthiazole kinase-like uncharacterized protein yjeF
MPPRQLLDLAPRMPRIVSAAEMRAVEARASEAGISESQLQRTAARGLADLVPMLGIGPLDGRVVLLVGPGNNGRDAMLAGAHLARRGYAVAAWLGPRHAISESELDEFGRLGIAMASHGSDASSAHEKLEGWLATARLAVDGLLGIGARGPLRPPLDATATLLNDARRTRSGDLAVLAVDVPSGIDSDDGSISGISIEADVTAALAAVKAGTLRFPAAVRAGRLVCLPIGAPDIALEWSAPRALLAEDVAELTPTRPLAGHKGTFGKVLVIGGSRRYLGAPLLSALAAARAGCGLVALATTQAGQQAAASLVPEATCVGPIDVDADSDKALSIVFDALGDFDAIVLGPGLGRDAPAQRFVRGLLAASSGQAGAPFVVDADALNVLAGWDEWWTEVHRPLVLTPHHGEMSRLSGVQIDGVARSNWEMAAERAALWRQEVVLKGPFTTVSAPGQGTAVHARANSALSTAGSGDVLAGLIGSLLAQGLSRWDAGRLGVAIHAHAARYVSDQRGWRSLIASDLIEALPAVMGQAAARPSRGAVWGLAQGERYSV